LTGSQDDVAMMVKEFIRRRDHVIDSLSSIQGVTVSSPGGAFYVFFSLKNFYGRRYRGELIKNSADMARYLLEHHHVAMVPGIAFGADDCMRMSFACSMADLDKGLGRIRSGLEQLG
jgi:aspartate aminotransferase